MLTGFASLPGPGSTAGTGAAPVIADTGPAARPAEPGRPGAGNHEPTSGGLPVSLTVTDASLVAQLTGGAESRNDTATRWSIHGTDLGHMFWHREHLYMVFGDTFGKGGLGGRHWRSNTLARLADPVPAEGLRIEQMITGPDGAARELIPSRKIEGVEKTIIPTNGISIGGRMYLHYMSVSSWGDAGGQWHVRHSGFAYSDDDGQTWEVPKNAIRPGGSGFEQVALIRHGEFVYTFGIPGGRWGGVRLRRARAGRFPEPAAYEYWTGRGWTRRAEAAALAVPAPVGELSVAWSERHRQWLMMYLNPGRRAAVLRTAPRLVGPWSEEQVVVTAGQYPGLYAPYIVPAGNLGDDVYFTMSMWKPYNVFLMHMTLRAGTLTAGGDPA